jgi:hypothetical protein
MASNPPDFYALKKGAVYDDLFPLDFADVMWQAFEKDGLESLTLEVSKPSERIEMRVLDVKRKRRPRRL